MSEIHVSVSPNGEVTIYAREPENVSCSGRAIRPWEELYEPGAWPSDAGFACFC